MLDSQTLPRLPSDTDEDSLQQAMQAPFVINPGAASTANRRSRRTDKRRSFRHDAASLLPLSPRSATTLPRRTTTPTLRRGGIVGVSRRSVQPVPPWPPDPVDARRDRRSHSRLTRINAPAELVTRRTAKRQGRARLHGGRRGLASLGTMPRRQNPSTARTSPAAAFSGSNPSAAPNNPARRRRSGSAPRSGRRARGAQPVAHAGTGWSTVIVRNVHSGRRGHGEGTTRSEGIPGSRPHWSRPIVGGTAHPTYAAAGHRSPC
jgi:hypothetical protein